MNRKIIIAVLFCLLFLLNGYYGLLRYISININPQFNINYSNLPRVLKKKPVIISFTTLPSRIESVKYTISSILSQTYRVDEIRLYIPQKTRKNSTYTIPKWMQNLQNTIPQFKIKICDKDWGPGTKIIPAILEEKNNDVYIIYLDDDMIYHHKTIETLIYYSNIYSKCAVGNSFAWSFKFKIFTGFSGVIVKPSFFNISKLLSVQNFPDAVIYNDDVYISGLLCENGIKRVCTLHQRSIPHFWEFLTGFILKCNPVSLSSTVNKTRDNLNYAVSCFDWKIKPKK